MAPKPASAAALDSAMPRIRLSLRWKAFGVLLLLLGAVHTFFAVFAYRQALESNRRDGSDRLTGLRQTFEAQLQTSARELGRIAAQIAASTSSATLSHQAFDGSRISPELLAEISSVRLFDGDGHPLGSFGASGPTPELEAQLLEAARRTHRPASGLLCREQCTQLAYEPAFDRDGREILVGIGQPVSGMLQAFARQTGGDVALLSSLPAESGEGALLRRHVYAVTHAPTLLPGLREAGLAGATALADQPFGAAAAHASFMLLLSPPAAGARGQVSALFVLDQSEALHRIRVSARTSVAASLGGLLLSGAVLWWFLTPLSRRLRAITRALPLLAEQRFAETRNRLDKAGAAHWLTDEIDVLSANARWLAHRLEQLNGAEAASAAKSRFLATLSHEVRTPLNGILGLLEVLQFSRLDAGQRDSVRMVHESAQSLLRVLDDTLDLARIEAGRIELESAPFNIDSVVAGCAETVAARARSKGLKLVAYSDTALPRQVIGDAMRLRQVLGNLLGNAVKFTQSGRVVVRAELAGRAGSAVRVRFSVQDSGPGIPEATQASLFQPFEQGGAGTTARFGGSGLGLSICQGLVRRMGGRIGFVSNPGAGTEFSFWLEFPVVAVTPETASRELEHVEIDLSLEQPDERAWLAGYLRAAGARLRRGAKLRVCERDPLHLGVDGATSSTLAFPVHRATLLRAVAQAAGMAPVADTLPAPQAPDRPLRILAVDDHPTNREVIQRQLALLGHWAQAAPDAPAALQMLGAEPYDLLLTDLRMPGMDGIELAHEVRRREAAGVLAGRIPVLALSAQPAAIEHEHCIAAGMDGCLSKPIGLEELRLALLPWTSHAIGPAPLPVEAEGAGEVAIDRAALARLLGADDSLIDSLLAEFLRVNAPLVASLPQLAASPDTEPLAAAAHRLLGSARTAQAPALTASLAALDQAARSGSSAKAQALTDAVAAEFARVRAEVEGISA